MNAIDHVLGTYFSKKVLDDSAKWLDAEKELSQLRATLAELSAQLRSFTEFEHCESCGGFMVLQANAPDDAIPFCPFCLCDQQSAQLQAAQTRIAELEQAANEAAEQIENGDIRIARQVLHDVLTLHPCHWDNVASPDFDGCNGCPRCCATNEA